MAVNALSGRVSGAALATYALGFQGVRYLWGGATPQGFDCSGLAQYVYKHAAGIDLPRVTTDQARVGVDVLGGPYLPGDLLFFHDTSHEGISLGGDRFVHAPHTGDVVRISQLGGSYVPNAARRILSDKQSAGSGEAASWGGWARRMLAELGAPASGNNLRFVLAWMRAENPASDYAWNPLATTLKSSGATRGSGVQAYRDEQAGLDATVRTITGGQYGDLRRALAGNAPITQTWGALRSSPWDAGHYASNPSPPYDAGDATRLVVGAKKGSGGILGEATSIAGDISAQVIDPFGLFGVGKSPADAAGAIGSGVLDPVAGAITDAAGAVVDEVEGVLVRGAYIVVGVLLAGVAGLIIVRSVGGGGAGGGGLPLPIPV